ncbi:M48 family metalloprotease [Pedobacter petrophilus]|uniref:M48 family metalloprotease n=1 Tax=Pedobacter petrophilus TaxID=1908241 RepID=A0A7K0FVB0_9SPHI|nr:M56 family metallopeptidase [Pedobacter petrophilus]MRX74686.1 M48 family metalloprotease [Pedobacter petrophilus]
METLVQQFIKAFGWSILNSLWQSAIIYGILFLVMLILPKLAARHRHNLAFASIVLMFFIFCYNLGEQLVLTKPVHQPISTAQQVQLSQYFNNLPETFSSKAERYFPLIVVAYVLGILLQLFIIAKGYHQLSKLKNENLSAIPGDWKLIFEDIIAKLGITKAVRFNLSSLVNVPLVIGYLKPVVLFPLALVNELDSDQVEAILIHELSHIRRHDFLLNLIKTAIETLLFFNPFVWMAGRFIHIEREHACDDLVLKTTGKPLKYAHALLKLELIKDNNSPAYALAATGKTQNLYQRIKRITNMKTNYLNAKQQMAALTLGVTCMLSIAWINPSEKKKEIKKVLTTQMASINNAFENLTAPQDTTKKRKTKIVTIDANGKKTEYNSVNEMPDSLKKSIYSDEFSGFRNVLLFNNDSSFTFGDSTLKAKMQKEFNSPEAKAKWKKFGEDVAKEYSSPQAQAKWKKFGDDVAKEYSSPQAQAKWKKFGEDVAKEYNSPEAQAKWKKFGEDVAKEYSSPEAQAKWKKFGEDAAKEYGSPEAQEKWKKMGEEMAAKFNSPEFKAKLEAANENIIIINGKKMSSKSRMNIDSLSKSYRYEFGTPNGPDVFYRNNQTPNKVKESAEYKKLKEQFDKEVKELKNKIEKEGKGEN